LNRNLHQKAVSLSQPDQAGKPAVGQTDDGEKPMIALPAVRQDQPLLLPEDAPRVRVTAGPGTASQKTWYIRRPVTLIGKSRNSSILLRGEEEEGPHCAIVNTGSAVLLKDLHTASGTLRNGKPIDLAVLADGDLLEVGGTLIQVAIQVIRKRKSQADATQAAAEPLKLPQPVWLRREGTLTGWRIEDTCSVIGRVEGAVVRVDGTGIGLAHALVFALNGRAALYRLAIDSPVFLNGLPVELACLEADDRLSLGDCTLTVVQGEEQLLTRPHGGAIPTPRQIPDDNLVAPEGGTGKAERGRSGLDDIRLELTRIREDVAASWQKINDWQGPERRIGLPDRRRSSPADLREAELDHQDAAIRGRLYDLTGYQEELTAREEELRDERQRLQQALEQLQERERALQERERQLAEKDSSATSRAE
jgi:pSer/pThr/pTyr-binding forkhead associated (FHA) protein